MEKQVVLDLESALERVEGDREFYIELLGMFFSDLEGALTPMRDAIELRNALALASAAHSIKSALGNLGAKSSFDMASKLEKMGRESALDGAGEVFACLEREIELFRAAVEPVAGRSF